MHAWVYQISDSPIEEIINENTLCQGEGTDYDYCAEISEDERKGAIEILWTEILPKGMFKLIGTNTLVFNGGIEEWKGQWVERIRHKVSLIDRNNVMDFIGATYKLEKEIENPLATDSMFYPCGTDEQTFAEKSVELMRWVDRLKVGSKIYIGGIIDFHF